jgi:hypothetical protein
MKRRRFDSLGYVGLPVFKTLHNQLHHILFTLSHGAQYLFIKQGLQSIWCVLYCICSLLLLCSVLTNEARGLEGWSNTTVRLAGWRRATLQGEILYVMDGPCRLSLMDHTTCPSLGLIYYRMNTKHCHELCHARKAWLDTLVDPPHRLSQSGADLY